MIDYAAIQRTANNLARRLGRAGSIDADDFAQESILCALRGRQSRRWPMIDLLRRQGWFNNHRTSQSDQPDHIYARVLLSDKRCKIEPEAIWSAAIDVQHLLARLTIKQREAVEMHYFAGLTQEEMSAELHIGLQAVKNRVHSGLTNMRRMIQ